MKSGDLNYQAQYSQDSVQSGRRRKSNWGRVNHHTHIKLSGEGGVNFKAHEAVRTNGWVEFIWYIGHFTDYDLASVTLRSRSR